MVIRTLNVVGFHLMSGRLLFAHFAIILLVGNLLFLYWKILINSCLKIKEFYKIMMIKKIFNHNKIKLLILMT
jgi:hypothetical protein